jgi:hypothetical protein
MICFDAEYLHVELYENPKVLVTQWGGECTSQEYREALLRFNSLIYKHKVPYAIADRRLLSRISVDDMDWTLTEYLEEFCKLPLKRFALLKAFDKNDDRYLNRFLHNEQYPLQFETKAFHDLDSAYDWLLEEKA